MSDFTVVDPRGWDCDLQSVYSAYIGYFQAHSIPWFDRTWGHLFSSFEEFLTFSWPVIVVTDEWTGRAHIVTKSSSIGSFLRMIKTRFGEVLPQVPNVIQVVPFERSPRHLRTISDYASYKKLHSTLAAARLSALKSRIRSGEPKAIRGLWERRENTFMAMEFKWSERNEKSCLEWGYAVVRCGHLETSGQWPPKPDSFRKGHFIVGEYVDRAVNRMNPTNPWQYAFGDSQIAPKAKLPQIINAIISSFATPDTEMLGNTLVIVGHGITNDLHKLEEMKIKIPHNALLLDLCIFERSLFLEGYRPAMPDPYLSPTTSALTPRTTSTPPLTLTYLIQSFTMFPVIVDPTAPPTNSGNGKADAAPYRPLRQPVVLPPFWPSWMNNSGNDALLCLWALQMLLEPTKTEVPTPGGRKKMGAQMPGMMPMMPQTPTSSASMMQMQMSLPLMGGGGLPTPPPGMTSFSHSMGAVGTPIGNGRSPPRRNTDVAKRGDGSGSPDTTSSKSSGLVVDEAKWLTAGGAPAKSTLTPSPTPSPGPMTRPRLVSNTRMGSASPMRATPSPGPGAGFGPGRR